MSEAEPEQPSPAAPIPLGATPLRPSPLGIGAWAWGDRLYWGFGRGYGEEEVRAAYHTSRSMGVTFFDTAEAYGRGRSERLLGELLNAERRREEIVVATKFFPYPWRVTQAQLLESLGATIELG